MRKQTKFAMVRNLVGASVIGMDGRPQGWQSVKKS